jgi:hypothetical protein
MTRGPELLQHARHVANRMPIYPMELLQTDLSGLANPPAMEDERDVQLSPNRAGSVYSLDPEEMELARMEQDGDTSDVEQYSARSRRKRSVNRSRRLSEGVYYACLLLIVVIRLLRDVPGITLTRLCGSRVFQGEVRCIHDYTSTREPGQSRHASVSEQKHFL